MSYSGGYNYDQWDGNSGDVMYGDSYGGFGDDGADDPYNFKIKDPKKEKRKKEKKERRRKAKERSETARLSIEERTAKRLEEMRLKRESRLAEIGPPPEDKSAKKGPAEEDAGPEQPEEDKAPATKEAQPKKTKTVKPYKTKKQKRRELEDAQENSFDSDLSESDFISGSYTKKRMEEFAAKREALKLSQDLERQKAEKSALNDEDQQPSFDPVNDSLATDDMDLGGTGNVRIGSVDSPMLKKYKKERDARGNQEKDEGEKQRKAKRVRADRVAGVDVL